MDPPTWIIIYEVLLFINQLLYLILEVHSFLGLENMLNYLILHNFRRENACGDWLANWVIQANNTGNNYVLDRPSIGLFPLLLGDQIKIILGD